MLKSHGGYEPLYIAARQGAIGGPIAAIMAVLVSATLTDEQALTDAEYEEAVMMGHLEHVPWRRSVPS